MDALIQRYFDAWNSHDAAVVAGVFAIDGTYDDPMSRIPVHPYDIAVVMEAIANVFPDFRFEITSQTASGSRNVVEWVLTGTNSKPLKPGIEPTGKKLHLRGVEILEGTDKLNRASRYFDQKSMFEQIGMQVIIEPHLQGKAAYGYSKRVASGNPNAPAVVALTWIRFRDQSELDHIRTHSAKIIQDFLDEPGFISIVTGAAGERAFTVTAWENEDALYRALDKGHSRAKHDFRTSDLSPGVWTSVWKPGHINKLWTRCTVCAQPNDATPAPTTCGNCGAPLPERPPYW